MPSLALLLLVPTQARAHYPHDVAFWFAVSPDPQSPAVVVSLERIDLEVLGRSENGLDWAARLVGAVADGVVTSATFATADRLFLATLGRGLLRSDDGGDHFTPVADVSDTRVDMLVASPSVMTDGTLFAAGTSHAWRSTDSGATWRAVLDSEAIGFTELAVSPQFADDGRVCAAEGARLNCSRDGGESWTTTAAPGLPQDLAVGADDRVWVVVAGEGLYLSTDGGQSWSPRPAVGADATVVAELSAGLVLVAEPSRAGWRSVDGGASWTWVDIEEIHNAQGGEQEILAFAEGPRGEVYMATWNGLSRSLDRGLSFREFVTERPENAHSISVLAPSDGRVEAWIGTYGSGAIVTDIRTHAAQDFPTLPVAFTRTSLAADGFRDNGIALHDEGYSTWRTGDGGASWTAIAEDPLDSGEFSTVYDVKGVAMAPDPAADPFLLTVIGSDPMSFRVSDDLGQSWTDALSEPECTGEAFAVAVSPRWHEENVAYGACDGDVYRSVDRGRSFQRIGQTGTSFVFRIAERGDGAVLVATSAGLWVVDDDGTRLLDFGGELVSAVATAASTDAPWSFALVPSRGWFRSPDGGETWDALVPPTANLPRDVDLSPSFDSDGVVVVGGYYGSWASRDRGDTWSAIHALDVYEEDSDAWRLEGSWRSEAGDDASRGEFATSGQLGAAREIDFQGITATLEVPASAATGEIAVQLDGGLVEVVTLPPANGVAWRAEGLADGWHTLRVEMTSAVATVDSLRVVRLPEREGEAARGAAPGSSEDCGCDGGAAAWLLPLALGWPRRRRTANAATSSSVPCPWSLP